MLKFRIYEWLYSVLQKISTKFEIFIALLCIIQTGGFSVSGFGITLSLSLYFLRVVGIDENYPLLITTATVVITITPFFG